MRMCHTGLTLSVDLDACNLTKWREMLRKVCIRNILGNVPHIDPTVLRVSSIYA